MTEIEVPLEKLQEDIQESAHHSRDRLMMRIALSSAFLAVFAAIAALLAGHHANEAMLEQIHASDKWSHYQAKSIKATIVAAKPTLSEADREKLAEYKKEQDELKEAAEEKERGSASHLRHHVVLARSVTMFQVAIAVAAISALTRKRRFWVMSLVFGLLGLLFMVQSFLFTT